MDGKFQQPITRQQSWYKELCNQFPALDLRGICFAINLLLCCLRSMALRGKTFQSSPLCSQQAGDSFSENDEEVEDILSQSQCESRKRSAQGADDCVPQKERRETGVSSTEPVNVIDWSPEQVKKWIFGLFGESVAEKFLEEEIDGQALLESKRLEDDPTLEKLGITTIGKKERFKRELGAVKPVVNDNVYFGSKKKKIDSSSFRSLDRLLTREERQHLSCKDKSIYNTKKRKITKEVEKRWSPGSVLPVYRNKADALQVDKFVAKLVEDDTHLFKECGFGKEAVLETVLKKIREQRRQQKERPLTKEEVLSTDSASESTESAESSSGSPSPTTYASQLQRVKSYNLYFDEDMPQTTADLIVMVALGKPSIKEVKMDQLQKMKKIFNLGLLRGKDKMTHIRAIANSLCNEGYITIPESKEEDQGSVTRGDVKVVKEIILGESTAKES